MPYFAAQDVPLTAVTTPNHELGARAVELMYNYLTGVIPKLESDMLPILFNRNNSVKTLRNA